MNNLPRIFCALDMQDAVRAKILAAQLSKAGCGVKLGLEFFNANGPQGVELVMRDQPGALFLDLKFHDIPNTVAGAVRAACALQPAYMNVHAAGGMAMMKAALQAAQEEAAALGVAVPRILAVTILTSMDEQALRDVGYSYAAQEQVVRMAALAQEAGMAGIVCSAHEIAAVRAACGPDFVLMVPGIRPAGADPGDQKRVMGPQEALAAGATHLVIGRPITAASNPAEAARLLVESCN